ncbi:MAG TPA: sugar transferase [Gemmatimonadales bacterium]|nr:sugar transferase [Gemmatimonadales bacterium]
MIKRLLDVLLAALALIVMSPVLALAAIGIRFSSPGPIFYRARLTGRNGRPFTMYKLRTMHVDHGGFDSVITAARDPRVFRFGAWLRRVKVDEFPQLINILRGDMSIVGPRPENARIVERYYGPEHQELLRVAPGLTSPGTLYDYTHGDDLVGSTNPEQAYVERLLPIRLALDQVYVHRASLWYDAVLVARTIGLIAAIAVGRRVFADPPELAEARRLLPASSRARASAGLP